MTRKVVESGAERLAASRTLDDGVASHISGTRLLELGCMRVLRQQFRASIGRRLCELAGGPAVIRFPADARLLLREILSLVRKVREGGTELTTTRALFVILACFAVLACILQW